MALGALRTITARGVMTFEADAPMSPMPPPSPYSTANGVDEGDLNAGGTPAPGEDDNNNNNNDDDDDDVAAPFWCVCPRPEFRSGSAVLVEGAAVAYDAAGGGGRNAAFLNYRDRGRWLPARVLGCDADGMVDVAVACSAWPTTTTPVRSANDETSGGAGRGSDSGGARVAFCTKWVLTTRNNPQSIVSRHRRVSVRAFGCAD